MKLYLLFITLQSAVALGSSLLTPKAAIGQTVLTSSGPVNGHPASNATTVSEYLGIPYGKSTGGIRRFAPPEKFTGNATINGTNFGFTCPQLGVPVTGVTGRSSFNVSNAQITPAGLFLLQNSSQNLTPQDEDCLSLNIWHPSGGEAKKAVMIFVYGGGFTTGSSSVSVYNGQDLAFQEDVIVVTLNYRLTIFGFPGNPTEANKNVAILDQRMAVEWCRDNIANFGGDPERMILFGQSAGSAALDIYQYAYANDTIVQGFIMESGTIGIAPIPTDPSIAWYNASMALGCGDNTTDAETVLACMQKQDINALIGAATNFTFGPAVDNITVFGDYPARAAAGNISKKPLLIGTNDFEEGLFETLAKLSGASGVPQSVFDTQNSLIFDCPTAIRANLSANIGIPTYRYRWFGVFPNTALSPYAGAYHTSEQQLIFGTLPQPNATAGIDPSTIAELEIKKYIQGAWAGFAKDPVNGLKAYGGGWPLYSTTASTGTLIRMGRNNTTGPDLTMAGLYDGSCAALEAGGNAPNGTQPVVVNGAMNFGAGAGVFWGVMVVVLGAFAIF